MISKENLDKLTVELEKMEDAIEQVKLRMESEKVDLYNCSGNKDTGRLRRRIQDLKEALTVLNKPYM